MSRIANRWRVLRHAWRPQKEVRMQDETLEPEPVQDDPPEPDESKPEPEPEPDESDEDGESGG